jgi:hypothetical protein
VFTVLREVVFLKAVISNIEDKKKKVTLSSLTAGGGPV